MEIILINNILNGFKAKGFLYCALEIRDNI